MAHETKLLNGKLLKVDRLGRVRTTRRQRGAILAEFDQSGLSGTRFAEIHGIKYSTLVSWLQERKRERQASNQAITSASAVTAPRIELTEVILPGLPESASALQVQLPGGISLQVADVHQARLAAELIRSLS
jgi:hypothetical protein